MRLSVTVLFVAMLTACAGTSANRPPEIARARVETTLRAPLMFGSSGTGAASFDITVTNPATVPVKVRRIRLSAPAMVEYAIRPVSQPFDAVLAPNETRTFSILTEGVASRPGLIPSEPLNLRTEVDFEVNSKRYREIYMR